jgi:hypothetical protein
MIPGVITDGMTARDNARRQIWISGRLLTYHEKRATRAMSFQDFQHCWCPLGIGPIVKRKSYNRICGFDIRNRAEQGSGGATDNTANDSQGRSVITGYTDR